MKNIMARCAAAGFAAGLAVAALGLAGCEFGSPNKAIRQVAVRIAGLYRNPDGRLVARNTGAPIVQLDVRQMGDRLSGIDNNGSVFDGRIGAVSDNRVSVTFEGMTTSGAEATLVGEVTISGNTATLRGTWIEPTLYSTVFGQATVQGVVTNGPPPATNNLAITAP